MITLKNISKSFGANKVLNKINISLIKKQCYGIIGPNGAGKSTLFKIITGNLHQDFGSIVFNNSNIDNLNVEKRSRLGISQSFQNNSLFNEMTVKENLMVASSQSLKITWNIFRSLDKNSDVLNWPMMQCMLGCKV